MHLGVASSAGVRLPCTRTLTVPWQACVLLLPRPEEWRVSSVIGQVRGMWTCQTHHHRPHDTPWCCRLAGGVLCSAHSSAAAAAAAAAAAVLLLLLLLLLSGKDVQRLCLRRMLLFVCL